MTAPSITVSAMLNPAIPWTFDRPALLWLLVLAALPWFRQRSEAQPRGALVTLGPDPMSRALELSLRALSSAVIIATVLALALPWKPGTERERTGHGAHVMVALDRSASMSEGFDGRVCSNDCLSKGGAAAGWLDEFVRSRPEDLFGVVFFSTAPIHVLNLSIDIEAVRAALRASNTPGLGLTNISAGLMMALEQFRDRPQTGARVVMLVSDGAARIEHRDEMLIRRLMAETQANLYWVFLRTNGGVAPNEADTRLEKSEPSPEAQLHTFFRTFGARYRLFTVDSGESLSRALSEIGAQENEPLRYREPVPRSERAGVCLSVAALGALLLALTRWLEGRS